MHDRFKVKAPDEWMEGWEKRYDREASLSNSDLTSYLNYCVVNQLVEILGQSERKLNILELGCGSGQTACFLAKLGHRITALDAIPKAIDLAKKRAKIMGVEESIDFQKADMLGWEIQPHSYDVIVVLQSLQYLLDHAMDKLKQILEGIKPRGYLVYSGNIEPHFETDPPIRFITREEFENELRDWTIHRISQEEWLLRPGDRRGFLQLLAQNVAEEQL